MKMEVGKMYEDIFDDDRFPDDDQDDEDGEYDVTGTA